MKTLGIYLGLGLFLSGLGMILIEIGGWNECGPLSATAAVGGLLNRYHIHFWGMIFHDFRTYNLVFDFFIMLCIPAVHLAGILFILKTLWCAILDHAPSVSVNVSKSGSGKGKKK